MAVRMISVRCSESPLFQRSTSPDPTNPKHNPTNHNSTNPKPINLNPKPNPYSNPKFWNSGPSK